MDKQEIDLEVMLYFSVYFIIPAIVTSIVVIVVVVVVLAFGYLWWWKRKQAKMERKWMLQLERANNLSNSMMQPFRPVRSYP